MPSIYDPELINTPSSIDTVPVPEETPLSVDEEGANIQVQPKLDMATLSMQAFKAMFAFNGDKTEADLWQAFANNEQYKLRQEAVYAQNAKDAINKQETIKNLAVNKMGPLSIEEYQRALDPWSNPVGPE